MKRIISTPGAPVPKGPYSQAIISNGLLYISGQLSIEPASGALIHGDIERETRQTMENLRHIVEASGAKMPDVIKTTCYLADMKDFEGFNKVYKEYFPAEPPARTTIQAAKLPLDAKVEIDAIVEIK